MHRQLLPHQSDAVNSIMNAINSQNISSMVISMPVGTGSTIVALEVFHRLYCNDKNKRTLFLLDYVQLCEQLRDNLLKESGDDVFRKQSVEIMTYQQFTETLDEKALGIFDYIICFEPSRTRPAAYPSLHKGTVAIGIVSQPEICTHQWFQKAPCVFSYTINDAIRDGMLYSVEHPENHEEAIIGFCKKLIQFYNGSTTNDEKDFDYNIRPDLIGSIQGKTLLIECKSFRNRTISTSRLIPTINRLSEMTAASQNTIGIIIIFGEVDVDEAKAVYSKHRIVIWDIRNLLFLTHDAEHLQNMIGNLAQFSISETKSKEPHGWYPHKDTVIDSVVMNTQTDSDILIDRLKRCKTGKSYATEYENICKDIIIHLFADCFNRIKSQCCTRDGLFRMDIVCALKDAGSFWRLIRHHYNSHFIVFECKNYEGVLDQNLVYTTEKYLFSAALRNVTIIISRKGFSPNASLAAEGCLKEHGKLILSVTDKDLIQMLKKKIAGEDPADYLIDRLEETLLPIGK